MGVNKSRGIIISPYWIHLIVAAACFVVAYWGLQITSSSDHHTQRVIRFLVFAGCLISVEGFTHFSIHPTGIWIRFLWIPIRWIPWDRLSEAQYLQEWTTTGNSLTKMEGHGILVTLAGCDPFYPEYEGLNLFLMKHPIRSFFIRFVPSNKKLYVETFKQYFPDLSFQFPKTAD